MSDYRESPGFPAPDDPGARAADNSLGDLFRELTEDVSTLMRQEVQLAKAELQQSAKTAGKGVGLLAGAGVAGHFALGFLSLAIAVALSVWIGLGWASLIVAVVWAIIGAVLASRGKKQLESVRGMPQTAATVKEIPPTLKPGEETP